MRFYGLADWENDEVIEFYPSRHAAETELREILSDEPEWAGRFEVVVIDFRGAKPTISSCT